ncbi:MAG TPA: hypothetical protein VGN30_06940 [Steroidobacteraceae bacterium]|jgi:hypothetical protein
MEAETAQHRALPPWGGHHRATMLAFRRVLERAMLDRRPVCAWERILAIVCEFRAASANGELVEYLEIDTERKLLEMCFALDQTGPPRIAAIVSCALVSLELGSSARMTEQIEQLERELLPLGDSLDRAIDRYARGLPDASRVVGLPPGD